MDKKTQKKRALYAALAMLLVSAIVITTASFAWFTLGKNVAVNELDLKVTKEGGIAISANTREFTEALAFEDLNGTSSNAWKADSKFENFFPEKISPASSDFSVSAGKYPAFFAGAMEKVYSTVGTETVTKKIMTSYAVTSANGAEIYGKPTGESSKVNVPEGARAAAFYAFDVYVKYVGSTEGETVTVNTGKSSIIVKNDETDGTTANENAVKAMRIGFVNCGLQADPISSLVFATPESDATTTKPVTSAGTSSELDETAVTVPSGSGIAVADSYDCTVATDQTTNSALTLSSGVNKIRVYIWMEGQSQSCTNELMSQLVSANIVFSMV